MLEHPPIPKIGMDRDRVKYNIIIIQFGDDELETNNR
jgi:hypothetical protein